MDRPAIDTGYQGTTANAQRCVDLRLMVWTAEDGWHARLSGIGTPPREFVSPFELARFLAQAAPAAVPASTPAHRDGGLR